MTTVHRKMGNKYEGRAYDKAQATTIHNEMIH